MCRSYIFSFFLLVLLSLFFVYVAFISAPRDVPRNGIVSIDSGNTVAQIGSHLKESRIIRSVFWFRVVMKVYPHSSQFIAGDYFFNGGSNLFSIASRIRSGDFGLPNKRLTIPEGSNIYEISSIVHSVFPAISEKEFVSEAKSKEGFLFPDTYFFPINVKAKSVVTKMEKTFKEKATAYRVEIKKFGKPLSDIVTMASIIEEEARDPQARRIISGILWKRIAIGMPLQVDATFAYINGKNTFELTKKDLAIDSPYNTYKYKGLPKAPITNPGLDAILAAVEPIKTKNLFFLSDVHGETHYAPTFAEHVQNKIKYLK